MLKQKEKELVRFFANTKCAKNTTRKKCAKIPRSNISGICGMRGMCGMSGMCGMCGM